MLVADDAPRRIVFETIDANDRLADQLGRLRRTRGKRLIVDHVHHRRIDVLLRVLALVFLLRENRERGGAGDQESEEKENQRLFDIQKGTPRT